MVNRNKGKPTNMELFFNDKKSSSEFATHCNLLMIWFEQSINSKKTFVKGTNPYLGGAQVQLYTVIRESESLGDCSSLMRVHL